MAYFASGFFGANYFLDGFFGNGITVPTPIPIAPTATGMFRKKKPKPKLNRQTLVAVRDYLALKVAG